MSRSLYIILTKFHTSSKSAPITMSSSSGLHKNHRKIREMFTKITGRLGECLQLSHLLRDTDGRAQVHSNLNTRRKHHVLHTREADSRVGSLLGTSGGMTLFLSKVRGKVSEYVKCHSGEHHPSPLLDRISCVSHRETIP